jgi:hypothetical protein
MACRGTALPLPFTVMWNGRSETDTREEGDNGADCSGRPPAASGAAVRSVAGQA